ncbi:serine protease [Mesorhizobium sp. M1428]|uniref:hypothetical protein n=1 Tax=Mesorhizobium sp. M1428 TaxID=2957102 RepID=UPI003337C5AA
MFADILSVDCLVAEPMPSFAERLLGVCVRVHSDIPKTVVFVGTEVGGRFNPLGTAFLGSVEHKGNYFNFVITAKHVIDLAGSQAVIRLNRKEREPIVLPLNHMKLVDPIHDLAVISIALPDAMDQFCLPLGRAVHLDELERKWRPDLGDEVATVGLYSSHHGVTRNVPVVRIGNIARMPDDELVRSNSGGYISAYLVETKSILGLSGSPVFVNVPRVRFDQNGSMQTLRGARITEFPIGVMIGYHLVRSAEDQIAVPHNEDADPGPDTDERNTGFAVVVPIERVFDLLEKRELVAAMDETVNHLSKTGGFRPASVGGPQTDDEIARKRDAGLLRALNTPPKPKAKPDTV